MKQTLFLFFIISVFIVSCERKAAPQQAVAQPVHPKVAPDRVPPPQYVKRAVILDSVDRNNARGTAADANNNADAPAAANVATSAIVVIDSHGKLQVNAASLPENVSHNLDSLNQATRAFTPEQVKNLAYRFNVIPPRVLLVPDNFVKKGVKGYYYKYQNKFWYWKKDDGFFYLDENYYK